MAGFVASMVVALVFPAELFCRPFTMVVIFPQARQPGSA
jgi:hypothetical protein